MRLWTDEDVPARQPSTQPGFNRLMGIVLLMAIAGSVWLMGWLAFKAWEVVAR